MHMRIKKYRLNSSKGFTLIELLAVIVILGVLMIIAIPMVTRYIKESRQNAFVDTAKAYINSARYAYLNGDYITPEQASGGKCAALDSGTGGTVYIRFSQIDVDKTGGNSSFGKAIVLADSYVKIVSTGDGKYTYSVFMRDEGSNGFDGAKEEDQLKRTDVKSGIDATMGFDASLACKKET